MKVVLGALVLVVALATSACGSEHFSTALPPIAKNAGDKVSVTAEFPELAKLSPAVRKVVERDILANLHPTKYSKVDTIEVYGPHHLTRLDAATDSGTELQTRWMRKARYYLTVLHGHFICILCRGLWVKPPRGTIETFIWSPDVRGGGSFGLTRKLPPGVSRLHRLLRISLR